ncbi:ribonuclease HI [Candidatus Woesebacteria bacterium CG22_combo_CG10-13_8_21_14_all_39_10]|uniref:Ribonuclease HI n=4 Tax=Candidatus Woeseibacteriota TaxID=1752722 RepID=A0A2M7X964_9BACT|nr:MAG: ribonuclease HI [Candidatus Woesebacteria bacterium CG22_combo_CG10-13_8_21_14_all_39_10]PIU71859.1 MAG: ribonuclease HI [Candidatus Woesebacteria bacterium CG06_land_8_20_14_3_00_39_27]PIZ49046.1 MAG: ribonuclease HI [Candidatus Woesebacteria bacterium CG_4_10_14_0_2_um_filter_39_14]PJA42707.1 MAG: ribonuclease HI [Candidatus Woesebacteria bacterium CG_4_9_14_3_um_filter_39_10]
MENKINIYCDGGSRGNPGKSASAFVVEDSNKLIYSESKYLGIATNNFAEYSAVLLALRWIVTTKLDRENRQIVKKEMVFILDSELVVKQINGVYKVKDKKLKEIYLRIKNILEKFPQKIIFKSVSREKNKAADFLVNRKLDSIV